MVGKEQSDEELLRAALQDPRAFEELYRRHVGKVVSFAVRRCASAGEVADLVAGVWLEVIASADRFDQGLGRAVPWILGIAANLSASETRRRAREQEASTRLAGRRILDENDEARLDEQIQAAAVGAELRAALTQLPPAERTVIELIVLDGLTTIETAEALRIRGAAVRMRLSRARRKLRRVLGEGFVAKTQLLGLEEVSP